jgi:hypothetical protein
LPKFNAGDEVVLTPPDDAPAAMLSFRGLVGTILERSPVFMTMPGSPAGLVVPHYFVSFQGVELSEVWPELWLEAMQGGSELQGEAPPSQYD